MRKACAWLLALALCGAGNATAALRLKLDAPELDPAQREASQQLLDEAADKLPPAFHERLDREIEVEWRDDLPANGMGQARGPQRIALNRKYLSDLTDGSAASRQTGRVHGTERRELLATLLHELTHVYDRARLWSAEEKREIRRCTRQEETSAGSPSPPIAAGRAGAASRSPTTRACSISPAGRSAPASAGGARRTMASYCAARTSTS